MLSHRDQFCTRHVTPGGVIMLSFMLLFNLSTSLAQWCDGDVQKVYLIGLTADHLVVITAGSEDTCSYYLPTDSLDTENMQIHLNGGLLLKERWPKFYEKFDNSPGSRFTVRDASGRNIIVVGKYAYDIDNDSLYELPIEFSRGKTSISSTKNMTYHSIHFMWNVFTTWTSNYSGTTENGVYENTIASSLIYQVGEETNKRIAYMCSDFDNQNIYLHKSYNRTEGAKGFTNKSCLICAQELIWNSFELSGFSDGKKFYFFTIGAVYILDTPELVEPQSPNPKDQCLCITSRINVTSKELSAFFTKPPPPDPTTPATTPPTTLSTLKRNWSTLPYDLNSNPAKSGSSSSRTGLIIGIVLIVILFVGAVCVCGCCCYKKKKKKKKKPKNADKNIKTDAGRGRIRGRSAEKLGANSRGKQGHKASSLKRSSLASVRKASSRKNLSSKRATSLAVASKKTGKPSSMRNDNLATSRQASSLRPSSRKNLSSKRATSLAVASKKTGKASSMRNDNLATSRQASSRRDSSHRVSSRRASSHKNLSSKRVSTQAVTSRRTGRSAGTKQSLASRK